MMNTPPQPLKDAIMARVRTGELSMRPRFFFSLQVIATITVIIAILLITIFIINFIFFSIRISGQEQLLGFGSPGIRSFLRFFPWHLLILDGLLFWILQQLLRRFRFGYRIPMLYLFGTLLCLALAAGFILDRVTPFNERMHTGRAHLPPPLAGLYEGQRKKPLRGSGICRCEILAIDGAIITVLDTREATSTLTVVVPPDNRRATTSGLSVGDVVFIAGEEKNGIVHAFGIKKERSGRR